MNNIAIEVKDLSKVYRLYDKPIDRLKEALGIKRKSYHKEFYALDKLNFSINAGETIGIIGTNGSGKSTLLKIITGVLNPSNGTVNVKGKISALLELGAGFNPEYTGYDNIYLNGAMFGFTKEDIDKKVESIVNFAGIGDFIYQPVKNYSSGMFARLAFSVAIHVEPEILIADEVLAVGDLEFQLKCMDKFNEFRNKGKTILYVSHDINSVKRYCSSCIWLQNGKIEAIGNTDNVTDRYLDYMKKDNHSEENVKLQSIETETSDLNIGQICEVRILDKKQCEVYDINYHDSLIVQVNYELFRTVINPVIGVAIRTIDNKYICGLNTKLDNYNIPSKLGENTVYLQYPNINLVGGTYNIDVALFESNAHVPIEYKAMVKKFIIHTPYVGEGVCILNHKWYVEGE
jgi:ABC-type polysaccharide/polyol phosphate transport system ATPase subunit